MLGLIRNKWMLSLLLVVSSLAQAQAQAEVSFAIIRTARLPVLQAMIFSGGGLHQVDTNFSAFLIRHGQDAFLFDSGLGRQISAQYQHDMPWWQRPFFRYDDPVQPARDQLNKAGIAPVQRIILSHSHWDHASALGDFPEAEVWASASEMALIRHPTSGVGGSWGSQVALPTTRWHVVEFQPVAYQGFASSLDLYGDGSVVLVPMPGHTPGSVGLFVTVASGRHYLFVGDVVWSASALREGRAKFWPARVLVDHDAGQTQQVIEQIRHAMQRDPQLVVVPAHDGVVQGALGYFPHWIR